MREIRFKNRKQIDFTNYSSLFRLPCVAVKPLASGRLGFANAIVVIVLRNAWMKVFK